jgi:PleD family two-component response regulator
MKSVTPASFAKEMQSLRQGCLDQFDVRVTFSAGIAAPGQHDSPDELIKAAGKALYSAENQGRNRPAAV